MLIEQTDYKGAVNWLAGEFGEKPVLEQAVAATRRTVEAAVKAPSERLNPLMSTGLGSGAI